MRREGFHGVVETGVDADLNWHSRHTDLGGSIVSVFSSSALNSSTLDLFHVAVAVTVTVVVVVAVAVFSFVRKKVN